MTSSGYLQKSFDLTLLGGLCLVPVLFIGYAFGVNLVSYSTIVIPHLIALTLALIWSARGVVHLVKESDRAGKVILLIACLFLFCIFLQALLPITSRDALIHHLAVPKWWNEAGSPTEIAWHPWSYYPMLIQTSFTWLLQLELVALTPFYHFAFLIILGSQVALILNVWGVRSSYALFGLLIIVSMPATQRLASEPLVDLALAVFCLQAIWYACQVIDSPDQRSSWLKLGIALGLAISTKPNGVLFVGVLVAVVIYLLASKRSLGLSSIKNGVLALAICASIYAPWAIRNSTLINNPFYPFGGDPRRRLTQVVPHPSISNIGVRLRVYGESLSDIAALPIRIFTDGQDNNPRRFDGVLSPLLLVCLIPAIFRKRASHYKVLYLTSAIFLFIALFAAPARARYLAPLYGPWAILCIEFLASTNFIIPIAALIIHTTIAGYYTFGRLNDSRVFNRLFSRSSDNDYLKSSIREWPVIQYINANLAQDSKTYLILTGNKFYFYQRPIITSGHQSEELLASSVYFSNSVDEIFNKLRAQGITHILAHQQRSSRSLDALLPLEKKELLVQFMRERLTPLYSANGFGLWQLH